MIKTLNENDSLRFKSLSAEEKEKRGILGRLYGPVASCVKPTRNERKYSQKLWEKLFESDIIKERFANGGIFGQLCHPDYEEVDMEKIAIVMPEQPVKDKDGQLVAYVDILDTPCGRIAYQLAKYGYKFGISSRGSGDLIQGYDGNEEVDPDTYQLTAFDLVEVPAVETARLSFVESLQTNKSNSLKKALKESLKKASKEERKIMKESLDALNLNVYDIPVLKNDIRTIMNESTKNSRSDRLAKADSVVSDKLDPVKLLQEALMQNKKLTERNLNLHKKLSVCYAKESKLEEKLEKSSNALISLSESAKGKRQLANQVKSLEESIEVKDKIISLNKSKMTKMRTDLKESRQLQAKLETLEKESAAYSQKLNEAKKMIKNYRNAYESVKSKYLIEKANSNGLSSKEVLSKLNESYKVSDIDKACDSLVQTKKNLNALPFRITEGTKIGISSSKKESIMGTNFYNSDDEVSDALLEALNLK